jgi:3-oxoacyl-[acyl-carrier protein] reductase
MFDNDVVLVTGGSRGIGRAIAFGMAAAGARVIGTSTSEAGAAELTAAFAGNGLNGRGAVLDVASEASIDALLAQLEATQSMPSILVNNAAITRDGLLLRMKPDDWNQVITTNLTAVYRLSKGVLRRMMKERRGRIITITSIVGLTGNPGQVNYAAAKAGVLGFTKSLALEVASRGITVNAVAPGPTATELFFEGKNEEQIQRLAKLAALERLGEPDDIANLVSFLAGPQGGWINAQTVRANGGYT